MLALALAIASARAPPSVPSKSKLCCSPPSVSKKTTCSSGSGPGAEIVTDIMALATARPVLAVAVAVASIEFWKHDEDTEEDTEGLGAAWDWMLLPPPLSAEESSRMRGGCCSSTGNWKSVVCLSPHTTSRFTMPPSSGRSCGRVGVRGIRMDRINHESRVTQGNS